MKRKRDLRVITEAATAEVPTSTTTIATPPKETAMKAATTAKKKGKKAIEEEEEEERKSSGRELGALAMESSIGNWEEGPWLGGAVAVDEQMPWGLTWLPFWDLEYVGEAYIEMFDDVAWDEDIWNLKSINKIPNP